MPFHHASPLPGRGFFIRSPPAGRRPDHLETAGPCPPGPGPGNQPEARGSCSCYAFLSYWTFNSSRKAC